MRKFLFSCALILALPISVSAATETLTATPNPCVTDQSTCTTKISWTPSDSANYQTVVSADGGTPSIFACSNTAYEQDAPWVHPGHAYTFSVYRSSACTAEGRSGSAIKSVVVQGQGLPPARSTVIPQGQLFIDPNPCVASNGICTTRVHWESTNVSTSSVQVWVSMDGQTPVHFSCNKGSFTENAPWIQSGHTYEFVAYTSSSCGEANKEGSPLSRVSVTGVPQAISTPTIRGVGQVPYMLALNFVGRGLSQSDGYYDRQPDAEEVRLARALATKALDDAAAVGTPFVRVSMTGFWPLSSGQVGDLDLWRTNPAEYWRAMDLMMDALDARNIRLIPEFGQQVRQFPALVGGETSSDFLGNPQSRSFALFKQYLAEFISRYKSRPTILFYEIGNEYNLEADIDLVKRCISESGVQNCTTVGNFTTMDMIGFLTRTSAYIRTLDPSRMVGSGNGMPRPAAEHLRMQPDFSDDGADWTLDSKEEFKKYLRDISQGLDIVSLHVYNHFLNGVNGMRDNERWGEVGASNANHLTVAQEAIVALGKKMYIGEFGDSPPNTLVINPESPFFTSVLQKVRELNIPYSSPWLWEGYESPTKTRVQDSWSLSSLEPGYTDALIAKIQATNSALGVVPNSVPVQTSPRVLLTWPKVGTTVADTQQVYVLASGSRGDKVTSVQFLLDGVLVSTVSNPPYIMTLQRSSVALGQHRLVARATDVQGKVAQDEYVISNGVVTRPSVVETPKPLPVPAPPTVPLPLPTPSPVNTEGGMSAPANLQRTALQGPGATTRICPTLSRAFSFGSRGNNVTQLQTFLIEKGDLAAGNNTGYFGRLTEAAVKKFQCRAMQICSGSAASNGYGAVGPRTRAAITALCR